MALNLTLNFVLKVYFCTNYIVYQGIHRFTIVKYDFHITHRIKLVCHVDFEYDKIRILMKLMVLVKTLDYKNNYRKK